MRLVKPSLKYKKSFIRALKEFEKEGRNEGDPNDVKGHIGYAIRPIKRKKGYGYKALELALKKAKKIGLKKVMLTCDDDNTASQKIIEKYGGKIKSKRVHEGMLIRHYWINLT